VDIPEARVSGALVGIQRIARPLFLFAGIAYIVAGIVKFIIHQDLAWLFVVFGAAFLLLAWRVKPPA
jgi:hypothetical protein